MTLRKIFGICMALLLTACADAQTAMSGPPLRAQIRTLGTTLRVLHITAHPGDEDAALVMYQARELGAKVMLLTLTRGESGDNRQSIMAPSEQGLLRTMEQLASDRQYGAEQRFTRVVNFGFARTADEVFDRWGGHNTALGDMVRVIRETRPEIVVTPFGSPDGDGQHQATAILAREAFSAAADAKKFPEQLKDGVQVWQAKRLFALVGAGEYTVAFDTNAIGKGEGESWQRLGEHALAAQRSQEGLLHAPRDTARHYRLIAWAKGYGMAEGAKDFAEGFEPGLDSIANAASANAASKDARDPFEIQASFVAMEDAAKAAEESAGDRASCVAQLTEYLRSLHLVEDRLLAAKMPLQLLAEVAEKRDSAERALLAAADVRVEARLESAAGGGTEYVLVPGAPFAVHVDVVAGAGSTVRVAGVELKPEDGRWLPRREWTQGETHAVFRGRVPLDAPFTRPPFILENDDDAVYRVLDERNATNALPPPSLQAVVELEVAGEVVRTSVAVRGLDTAAANSNSGNREAVLRTAVVAPPMSVIVEPRVQWNRRTNLAYGEIEIRVRSNLHTLQNALLSVHPPSGWRAEPEHEVLDIEGRGEEHSYRFFLVQERGVEGNFPVRAVVHWGSAVFDQGYTIVHGPGDQVAFDYRLADGSLNSTDIDVPENIEIGYVGVKGDPIPATLRDIGVKVVEMGREELLNARLGQYWAIVIGSHAVDSRDKLGQARSRLLQYAEKGGVLVILAQSDVERFSQSAPFPYPVELGTARVSNEASAVQLLDEHDDAFQDPNELSDEDFRGWTEERGRNFAKSWNAHFEPLMQMNDPGQPPQQGALIRAPYERGFVVYSGLSFARQISAGVPGALRLFVNLISLNADLH